MTEQSHILSVDMRNVIKKDEKQKINKDLIGGKNENTCRNV